MNRKRIVLFCLLAAMVSITSLFGGTADDPAKAGAHPEGTGEYCYSGCTMPWWLSCWVWDPVSASAGTYYFDIPLLQLGGPMNPHFALKYRSDLTRVASYRARCMTRWRRCRTACRATRVCSAPSQT